MHITTIKAQTKLKYGVPVDCSKLSPLPLYLRQFLIRSLDNAAIPTPQQKVNLDKVTVTETKQKNNDGLCSLSSLMKLAVQTGNNNLPQSVFFTKRDCQARSKAR
jgi:hypothetical protein